MRNARKPERKRRGGFTLVELMVVVVILGLLATVVGTNVIPMLFESKIDKAKMDISNIKSAVRTYMIRNNSRLPEGLEELVTPDERGYVYLEDMTSTPRDPWDNEYILEEDPERLGGFIIRSFGPDGERDTEDDITNLNMRDEKEQM